MPSLTRAPRKPVHGVLLLDKPEGLSSHTAMRKAARALQAARCGHGGTLDPLASGLLIVMLGAATKFSEWSLQADKRYRARVRLGITTTTDDREGAVLERRPVAVSRSDVEAALPRFTGDIEQRPPSYSAIKRDGRKLYDYARAGQTVDIPVRKVHVHAINMEAFEDDLLTLSIDCAKGTYIRSLARDLGEALGCGAHLDGLIRQGSGAFALSQAVALDQWQAMDDESRAARLLPTDALMCHLPAWLAPEALLPVILHGQSVPTRQLQTLMPLSDQQFVRLYVRHQPHVCFVGVYLVSADLLLPRRLLSQDEFHQSPPSRLAI